MKIADTWAEVHIVLSYYSIDEKISLKRKIGTDYAACNLTYLHAYLTQSEWALISQRIANFGEKECKCLMVRINTKFYSAKFNIYFIGKIGFPKNQSHDYVWRPIQ